MKRRRALEPESADVESGAVPAEALAGAFPPIDLPVAPPFPPMEAKLVTEIPAGDAWLYEPKWDGFRCLAFRAGDQVLLQSKAGQPLGRYFPEVVAALTRLGPPRFVLDGEIVVGRDGALSFDDLLQRIHPAESRVRRLAAETPATLLAFDLLVDDTGRSLVERPLAERRPALEAFFAALAPDERVTLSPATRDRALADRWMRELGAAGLDGVIAKKLDEPYRSGDRSAMQKVKRIRTVECVVGGFRWAQKGGEVGSLLLGLSDAEGLLHHVGFSSSFTREERGTLKPVLEPLVEPPGFTGSAPGGPSRWATERSAEWQPLRPVLVAEVRYDHYSGDRFRHGTKFVRWRPDKDPRQCTFDQLETRGGRGALTELVRPRGAGPPA
jgi:ATP-dependent DNA ligase